MASAPSRSTLLRSHWREWTIYAFVIAAVGLYYSWAVRASGSPFVWGHDLGGYYDYLGRGFTGGHLYVPIKPSPELLRMPNPWDPGIDERYKMQDMALFRGHYYLYFGAAPAALLFWPWRLATGHDLPENFALVVLCFGGFLFSAASLVRLLNLANARAEWPFLGMLLLALGICQSIPYLLNRAMVYEVAIGSGYFFLSGAVFCLVHLLEKHRAVPWMAGSGLMFGLAMASRPHLGLAAAVAAVFLGKTCRFRSRAWTAFVLAFFAICVAVGIYNYQRFENPLEFGLHYELAGPGQNQLDLAGRNVIPGLYFMLLRPPDFSLVFPWVHLVFRHSYEALEQLPPQYFLEPTLGALWLVPFVIGAVFLPRGSSGNHRLGTMTSILRLVSLGAGAVLLFLVMTHLSTQRYESDFVPLAVWAALAGFALRRARAAAGTRWKITACLAIVIAYSALVNLALGLEGPYNDILHNRPASYVRLARWFSPVRKFCPLLDPEVRITFNADFRHQETGFREPLVAMGQAHHWWLLYIEHRSDGLRLVSRSEDFKAQTDLVPSGDMVSRFRVTYSRRTGAMQVERNGQTILRHPLPVLVTAPAQVTIGENGIDADVFPRFTGQIKILENRVVETGASEKALAGYGAEPMGYYLKNSSGDSR